MLDVFRQRGLSNVIYGAIIVATIFAFVVTFRPQAQNKTASLSEACAARVRGRCIDPKDFGSAYRMLSPNRSQATSRKLNLKKAALDGLIERELLDDEAKRLGIGMTEKELTDQLYSGYVRISVPAADPKVTAQLMLEMFQAYQRGGLISPEVAQAHFNDRDTAIPVDFRDPKTKIFDMKVYERQVRNIANRSTTEFREQQGRELLASKVRDAVREPIRISGAEAWDEYERQKSTAMLTYIPVHEGWAARWATTVTQADLDLFAKDHQAAIDAAFEQRKKQDAPQAGHIRQILVRLPFGASDEERATALAKLSWAAGRVRAGEPFAEVARDASDDQSASKGGDVGDKTDGTPFKAVADALKPGETTAGAVETQLGFHLLQRDDPSKAADIEERVKRSVARELVVKSKAVEAAQFVATKIDQAMRGGKNAEDAMKDAIAPYVRTVKMETLRVLPQPAGAASDAGADGGVVPKQPTTVAPFDASTDVARPQTQTSNAFNRGGDPFPGLTPDGAVTLMSFAFAGKEGDVMDVPLRTPDGYYVIVLRQHKQATREEFDKDRDSFEQDYVRAKRDETLSLYVKHLREVAKDDIKVDDAYITEAKVDGGTGQSDDEDEY